MKRTQAPDAMILKEVAESPAAMLGSGASCSTLHYCSPAHGGWGVVRAGLLLPESYLLFACPAACGRHGAIAAIEQGYKHRVGYLCLTENEIVLGGYEEEIRKGMKTIAETIKPKALILCVSCIDDLLGTDHERTLKDFEAQYGIPAGLARMNPITLDDALPPALRIQQTIYGFLKPAAKEKNGIGPVVLLGAFVPPSEDSELAGLVKRCGFPGIAHPSFCPDFEAFQSLSMSSAALVIRPEGKAAARLLEESHRIPVLEAVVAHSRERILSNYRRIAEFLCGVSGHPLPDLDSLFGEVSETLRMKGERLADEMDGADFAIDATATASPFDLALALTEYGFQVKELYVEKAAPHDKESLNRLAVLGPELKVVNPAHSRRAGGQPAESTCDIAIGFTAAYASAAEVLVPLSFDENRYGFEGAIEVIESIDRARNDAGSVSGAEGLRGKIAEYGLVI